MIADYAVEPALYEECLTLMDSCFPGIKAIADLGRSHMPIGIEVRHRLLYVMNKNSLRILVFCPLISSFKVSPIMVGAIHGVCTKEGFRRKGRRLPLKRYIS